MFFIIISALHFSGGISAHYQELMGSNPSVPAADNRKARQYPRLHIQFYKLLVLGYYM